MGCGGAHGGSLPANARATYFALAERTNGPTATAWGFVVCRNAAAQM
jgi:hypothetical protein